MGVCNGEPGGRSTAYSSDQGGGRAAAEDYKVQSLANTAWAFATVNQSDVQLLTDQIKEAVRHLSAADHRSILKECLCDRTQAYLW